MICGQSSDSELGPYMRMYFHTGLVEYVLFKGWVPRTGWQYALSWIFVAFITIFGLFLKSCRHHYDQMLRQKEVERSSQEEHPLLAKIAVANKSVNPNVFRAVFPQRKHFKVNAIRMLYVIPIVTIDFLVMLVAMTFNVGLFIAVVTGYALGTLLFGHGLEFLDNELDCCSS
jgi:solute carrier family 31 (copper transporter), member 1